MSESAVDFWKLGKRDLGTFQYNINKEGHLSLYAGNKEHDLVYLVEKHGTPLEIAIPEIVKENVRDIRTQFESAIAKQSFEGEYAHCYPMKSSQLEPFVTAAVEAGANLEVGSYMELLIAKHLLESGKISKESKVICNGAKNSKYLDEIIDLQDKGYSVIPIVEAEQEYFSLLEQINAKGVPKLDIGIRARTGVSTNSHWNSATEQNIFGISRDSLVDFVLNYVLPERKMSFKILHCHAASQIESKEDISKVITALSELYCELKALEAKDLSIIDVGGGLSVPYDKSKDPYSLENYANEVVGAIKKVCSERNMSHPSIIVESGRRTVANAQLTVFGTQHTKKSGVSGLNWIRVDGSFMNDLPDTWGVQQKFWYVPLNGLETQISHLRKYWLAGMTCDSDDVYPPPNHSSNQEKVDCVLSPPIDRYATLPNGEKLYIAFLDTGAYQDSISGLGGAHHCLIPEPKKIILKENGEIEVFDTNQDPVKILAQMGWKLGK